MDWQILCFHQIAIDMNMLYNLGQGQVIEEYFVFWEDFRNILWFFEALIHLAEIDSLHICTIQIYGGFCISTGS